MHKYIVHDIFSSFENHKNQQFANDTLLVIYRTRARYTANNQRPTTVKSVPTPYQRRTNAHLKTMVRGGKSNGRYVVHDIIHVKKKEPHSEALVVE